MKLNKIILFFCVTLPIGILLRFLQLYFTIEPKTGFYLANADGYGQILLLLILLVVLLIAVFSNLAFYRPENPPKINIYLRISSLILADVFLFESFTQKVTLSTILWQSALLRICSVATAVFFIFYAISPLIKIQLPNITTLIPIPYFIIKIIYDFTAISKLALISDNVILIACYCVTLLFFLNFAKLYNNFNNERSFKRILSSGLCASALCLINSIPNIFINLITKNSYSHISMQTNFVLLFVGAFALSFVFSYFFQKENQTGK